jgi:hypothetical protein
MQPHRILDIGVGNGRVGFLVREYSGDDWRPRGRPGPVTVDGIEGYEPYIGHVQRAIYNDLIIAEALTALEQLGAKDQRYELAVASDVIEHFDDAGGLRLLRLADAITDVLLVVTPIWFLPQEMDNNPLETHRSHWSARKLREEGARLIEQYEDSTLAWFGDRAVIAEFAATRRQLRRWLFPPEVHRLLRQARRAAKRAS